MRPFLAFATFSFFLTSVPSGAENVPPDQPDKLYAEIQDRIPQGNYEGVDLLGKKSQIKIVYEDDRMLVTFPNGETVFFADLSERSSKPRDPELHPEYFAKGKLTGAGSLAGGSSDRLEFSYKGYFNPYITRKTPKTALVPSVVQEIDSVFVLYPYEGKDTMRFTAIVKGKKRTFHLRDFVVR